MSNVPEIDYAFNFKFNLHKSLIPIGIEDNDYERLQTVYGVDDKWMNESIAKIKESNVRQAEKLGSKFDFSKLVTKSVKIVFLGDSITSDRQSYLNILKEAMKKLPDINLVDMAISGHKSGDLFTAIYPNTIGEQADIAHIMIGTNDVRRINDDRKLYHTSPSEYEKNVEYVVSALVKEGTKVILTTIPPYSQEKADRSFVGAHVLFLEEDRKLFNGILTRIAEKYGAILNNMDDLYSKYSPEELTLDDGIHLNEMGQGLLCEGVAKTILELMNYE